MRFVEYRKILNEEEEIKHRVVVDFVHAVVDHFLDVEFTVARKKILR